MPRHLEPRRLGEAHKDARGGGAYLRGPPRRASYPRIMQTDPRLAAALRPAEKSPAAANAASKLEMGRYEEDAVAGLLLRLLLLLLLLASDPGNPEICFRNPDLPTTSI